MKMLTWLSVTSLLLSSLTMHSLQVQPTVDPTDGDVRLVEGPHSCFGKLELKNKGQWRQVPHFGWNDRLAAVICRQLNCGNVRLTTKSQLSWKSVWGFGLSSTCSGQESSVRECTEINDQRPGGRNSDVRVELRCSAIPGDTAVDGDVKLVGGIDHCRGKLEVKSEGEWREVDHYGWRDDVSSVVCRQLNCGTAFAAQKTEGSYTERIWKLYSSTCDGSESSMRECGVWRPETSYTRVDLVCSASTDTTLDGDVRLVGGTSPCAGELELKNNGEWRPLDPFSTWTSQLSSVVCRQLNCGNPASFERRRVSNEEPSWWIVESDGSECDGSQSSIKMCGSKSGHNAKTRLDLVCSESTRLVNGSSSCSGRVEVKSNQSWVPVCEGDFDQKDAQVVCRELGCGPPSVLQGALYGEGKAPMSTKEFQCEGSESALQDCRTSDSTRNTCSPDKSLGLTCSEPVVRLVGGTSQCAGTVETKHGVEWRPLKMTWWNFKSASIVCRELNCGSAVSVEISSGSDQRVWQIRPSCAGFESSLAECGTKRDGTSRERLEVMCSESVRLVDGSSPCSGRVEVKSDQSWVPVCDGDFDQNDAKVVCRELGCGAPSVLQGALYREGKAPMSTKEFQCEGSETALQDCRSSKSSRNTCSPDRTVGLTCSEPEDVRLVGGTSNCTGTLKVKHRGEWRRMYNKYGWQLESATVVCRQLDCGSAVSTQTIFGQYGDVEPEWQVISHCDGSESSLRECGTVLSRSDETRYRVEVTCSALHVQPTRYTTEVDDLRLVRGSRKCSGEVEMKHEEWLPIQLDRWEQKLSTITCRQLGCGTPVSSKVISGSYYGLPAWQIPLTKRCSGSTSLLRECGTDWYEWTAESTLELTCSGSVKLVNGPNSCSGRVEVMSDQSWVPVCEGDFDQKDAEVLCRQLDCGPPSVLQAGLYGVGEAPMSTKEFQCEGTESVLQDCRTSDSTRNTCSPDKTVGLTCSDLDVKLVGGTSHCAGTVEMKNNGQWRPIDLNYWNLRFASVLCRQLNCGSPVSTKKSTGTEQPVWWLTSTCDGSEASLRACKGSYRPSGQDGNDIVEVICSESVRLVNGSNSCSGRVEVKSDQSWVSVCEGDFDQQDAEVVCRHLDCGDPSVLQGALYGEGRAPMSTKEFQCEGSESVLQDCRSSDSTRTTCSPDKSVGLSCTASEIRLVGGTSRCNGIFEMQHQGKWRRVGDYYWNQQTASLVCRQLNCGSLVSTKEILTDDVIPVWLIRPSCKAQDSSLGDCILIFDNESRAKLEVICSAE